MEEIHPGIEFEHDLRRIPKNVTVKDSYLWNDKQWKKDEVTDHPIINTGSNVKCGENQLMNTSFTWVSAGFLKSCIKSEGQSSSTLE